MDLGNLLDKDAISTVENIIIDCETNIKLHANESSLLNSFHINIRRVCKKHDYTLTLTNTYCTHIFYTTRGTGTRKRSFIHKYLTYFIKVK